MFEHQEPIGDARRQCAAAPPLADHTCNDRDAQPGKRQNVFGNSIPLTTLLRFHARIGARRIDEADQREARLFGVAKEMQPGAAPLEFFVPVVT